jgi:hypothetical protein
MCAYGWDIAGSSIGNRHMQSRRRSALVSAM